MKRPDGSFMLYRYIILITVGAIAMAATPAAYARDLIGIYQDWAAFAEPTDGTCFAIAQPKEVVGRDSQKGNSAFTISFWPKKSDDYQVYVRFSRDRSSNSVVTLTAGGRRFRLDGNRTEAWAKDQRMNIAIVAALRSSASMSIESTGRDGRAIVDAYRLRGAASAIDAAALACK